MAAHALRVQDALHEPRVVERLRSVRLRRDLRRRTAHRERRGARREGRAPARPRLVAAVAGELLARRHVGVGAHRLHGAAVFVERLEIERHAHRRLEVCAAVRLHRHRAEALPTRRLVARAEARTPHVELHLRQHLPHAERRDLRVGGERIARVAHVHHANRGRLRQLLLRDGRGTRPVGRGGTSHERLVGDHRRLRARRERHRVEAGVLRMRVDADLVAERVEERDVVTAAGAVHGTVLTVRVAVVHAEIVVFGERPRGGVRAGVVHLRVVRLAFGEELVGRETLHGAHRIVVRHRRVDHDQRAAHERVVSGGRRHVAARAGDLAYGVLGVRPHPLARARVAVELARVASVGIGDPHVVRLVEAAVHVVPARVHDHAVRVHGRTELVRLVRREAGDVGAIGEHREKRVRGHLAAVAASEPAAALADERDASVRQPAREEVVDVAGRDLLEVRAVRAALEDVEHGVVLPHADLRTRLRVAEEDFLSVKRHVRREEPARVRVVPARLADEAASLPRSLLHHAVLEEVHELRVVGERVFQHVESVAAARLLRAGVEAEELVADVRAPVELLRGEHLARDEEQLVDGFQERVLERDGAPQAHRLEEEREAGVDIGDWGFRGRGGERGEGGPILRKHSLRIRT